MGCVKTCGLCGGCVTEGPVTGISMHSVKENVFMQMPPEDSPSNAPTAGLPDLVASCTNAARSPSSCENSQSCPELSPDAVKLIGRRLRHLSDHFARRDHKANTQDGTIHDWFAGFLRVCASTMLELWKLPT
ncbi:uncharacterized protein LOC144134485 [Amblyomma americanum]